MFFFFNDTATTEIYTLSLHDALPIFRLEEAQDRPQHEPGRDEPQRREGQRRDVAHGVFDNSGVGAKQDPGREKGGLDRKSTRLNSSHANISYAVFCLTK